MASIPTPPFSSAYRPPQWSKPSMVSITVPPQSTAQTASTTSSDAFTVSTNVTAQTTYVFDAVLSLEHEQRITKTRHPVQTGADISSHAYIEPAELVLYVGMSDAMDQYTSVSQLAPPYVQAWSGNPSKSVSAYQQLLALQKSRVPLTVTTRLRTYQNMLIVSLPAREDHKTITGLRARVVLEEIPTATISTTPLSTRPNDTNSTGLGAVSTIPPSTPITNQFGIPPTTTEGFDQPTTDLYNWLIAHPTGIEVPGAGKWSSLPSSTLQQLGAP